jgi:histidine ammonia-lyase
MTIHLDGPGVSIDDVVAVARGHERVALTDAAGERMAAARLRGVDRVRRHGHRGDTARP